MDKAMSTLVIALAIGGLLGFGGGYYYMENAQEAAFAEGMAYQQSVTPQAVSPTYTDEAELDFSSMSFDHTATVDVNGDVAADTEVTQTLTITNDDDIDADNVYIYFTDGLDSDLDDAIDDIVITIDFGGISGIRMLWEGDYNSGYELGDIPAGADMDVTVNIEFLVNDDGDFPDGRTLDCELYILQPGANNIDDVDFDITT